MAKVTITTFHDKAPGKSRTIDPAKCPNFILMWQHYRADGTCRCDDPTHALMREWGYEWDVDLLQWNTPIDLV